MSAVALPETLTLAQARSAMAALKAAVAGAPGPLVRLDASGLRQLDTSAIAVLLQCRRQAQARGLSLVVDGMPPKLAALLALYGVTELFPDAGADATAARPH